MPNPLLQPTHLLTLASGLRLAVDESGTPGGLPIFFFHGWPASRLQGAGFSIEAREMGLRIIAPDRPGIGLSSAQARRTLLDWPPLVRELAAQLGMARFMVLGVSGGGPYALAVARALPEMVESVLVVSGAPPLGLREDRRGLLRIYRWLLGAHRFSPFVLRSLFWLGQPFLKRTPPRLLWPLLLRLAPNADRCSLGDASVLRGSLECHSEAWRGSAAGVFADGEIYLHDWGFEPEEIMVPTRIWHGKRDTSFPWQLAERLASRIPGAVLRLVEGEGHYSLPIMHKRAILEDLLAARAVAEPAGVRH